MATAFGYFSIGRLALPDLPLAFWITLTTWAALVGLCERPSRTPRRWLLLAGAAVGLGFLTKGPVAIILPALVDRAGLLARAPARAPAALRDRRSGRSWPSRWRRRGSSLMAQVHGTAYLEGFFVGDNLERFATSRFNDPRPPWFYLPIVAGGLLPWTPLMLCGARADLAAG